jgi:hypothetical protein
MRSTWRRRRTGKGRTRRGEKGPEGNMDKGEEKKSRVFIKNDPK